MQRSAIDVGINGDGTDAHLAAGANDAYGDFPAIGDQYLFEHGSGSSFHPS
jgi:hypothetical protein